MLEFNHLLIYFNVV